MQPLETSIEHQDVRTNGVRLHVVAAGPEDGRLLVFLHGFPEFWIGWKKQIPYFASRGFRVVVPDQRGYNLSDKPAGAQAYRLENLAADAAGLIQELGREKAVVVGHDWGAAVAWALCGLFPERVDRAVILNVPHPAAMRDQMRYNLRQALRSWYIAFFQIPALPEALAKAANWRGMARSMQETSRPGTFTQQDFALYRQAWGQPGAITAMMNWYRALLQAPPTQAAYQRVRLPVLIIWGAMDRFLGRELAQPSIDLCDRGRLVMIEEATHWVQHEEASRVNELIFEFLKD